MKNIFNLTKYCMEFLLKTFGDPIYSDIETLHVTSPYTSDSISDVIANSDTCFSPSLLPALNDSSLFYGCSHYCPLQSSLIRL